MPRVGFISSCSVFHFIRSLLLLVPLHLYLISNDKKVNPEKLRTLMRNVLDGFANVLYSIYLSQNVNVA